MAGSVFKRNKNLEFKSKKLTILAIETSCDETSVAIVENGEKILSNIVASSADIFAKIGGIIPEQAARQQLMFIIPVLEQSLKKAYPKIKDSRKIIAQKIDAIAVTVGPGLIGSLLVGIETAKVISFVFQKPLIPVNHLVGHIYANWLNQKRKPPLPGLSLIASGGHTDLVLLKKHGEVEWLGGTRDDAAGEAFDKTARLLGLPYPGGPSISSLADKFFEKNKNTPLTLLPRPLANEKNFDFSFSGLKTHVANIVKRWRLTPQKRARLAAEIQEAIVDSLIKKVLLANDKYKPKSIHLVGGVAANKRLRQKIKYYRILQGKVHVPPPSLCTDNAAFIASCAYYNFIPKNWEKIEPIPDLKISGFKSI